MIKTLYIGARIDSGPSYSYIQIDVEVCGLGTISLINSTDLSLHYNFNPGMANT